MPVSGALLCQGELTGEDGTGNRQILQRRMEENRAVVALDRPISRIGAVPMQSHCEALSVLSRCDDHTLQSRTTLEIL